MIRAIKLDPPMIEAGLQRSRELRNEAFADLGRSIGNGLRRAFRALSRALVSGKGGRSPFAGSVRVGWL